LRAIVEILGLTGYLLSAAGCAGPAARYHRSAENLGFSAVNQPAGDFTLRLYWSRRPKPGEPFHIYLDGDGTPWRNPTRIAADPTPRRPLVLRLMSRDPFPSVLVGRPCYHGQADSPCTAALWTDQRYSQTVVDALAQAIRDIRSQAPGSPATLIGFSGGGALAMLLAASMPVDAVVTIAGNLDTEAWTRHHGQPPLLGSSNPAELPPLQRSIRQLHLAGGRDRQVPPVIIRPIAEREPNAVFQVIEEFDHGCCWERIWPDVLESLPAPSQ
jgi:pimeloyl-ACP methyl ester carboxylesterase